MEILTRRDVVSDAITNCLKCMYETGYPSIDLDVEMKKMKDNPELRDRPLFDMCYLPKEKWDEISNAFQEAYRLNPELPETFAILKEYFKAPSVVEYLPDQFGTLRSQVVKGEPMPEDVHRVVCKYFDMAEKFYRWDGDLRSFQMALLNWAPNTNRESVEKYYHENGNPDFKIPEDSYWDKDDDV